METKLIQIIDTDGSPFGLFRFPVTMSDEEIQEVVAETNRRYQEDEVDDISDELEELGYERVFIDIEIQLPD